MARFDIDLPAYFHRIGYGGPAEPTRAALGEVHRLHVAAIAFENLSPLIGDDVPLDLASLQAKLVRGGRGGYCFEHNLLLWAALEAMGFEVRGLAARVLWGAAENEPLRHRSHMALMVSLPEGPFVADVGFGGITMSAPLALEPGVVQPTPHEPFRLIEASGDAYDLQADAGGHWLPLYRFDLAPQLPVDYEPLNWFVATHPSSPFPAHLLAARAEPHRRLALFDARYTVREKGLPPVERILTSLDDLATVLTEDFGLALPPGFERVGPKLGLF
ncbi:MAG TPA: arylamine N-acetyltransferase [Caulobacteraceae bacterium]|jgi:N-hydroxyarylamine O-acetyltransferase